MTNISTIATILSTPPADLTQVWFGIDDLNDATTKRFNAENMPTIFGLGNYVQDSDLKTALEAATLNQVFNLIPGHTYTAVSGIEIIQPVTINGNGATIVQNGNSTNALLNISVTTGKSVVNDLNLDCNFYIQTAGGRGEGLGLRGSAHEVTLNRVNVSNAMIGSLANLVYIGCKKFTYNSGTLTNPGYSCTRCAGQSLATAVFSNIDMIIDRDNGVSNQARFFGVDGMSDGGQVFVSGGRWYSTGNQTNATACASVIDPGNGLTDYIDVFAIRDVDIIVPESNTTYLKITKCKNVFLDNISYKQVLGGSGDYCWNFSGNVAAEPSRFVMRNCWSTSHLNIVGADNTGIEFFGIYGCTFGDNGGTLDSYYAIQNASNSQWLVVEDTMFSNVGTRGIHGNAKIINGTYRNVTIEHVNDGASIYHTDALAHNFKGDGINFVKLGTGEMRVSNNANARLQMTGEKENEYIWDSSLGTTWVTDGATHPNPPFDIQGSQTAFAGTVGDIIWNKNYRQNQFGPSWIYDGTDWVEQGNFTVPFATFVEGTDNVDTGFLSTATTMSLSAWIKTTDTVGRVISNRNSSGLQNGLMLAVASGKAIAYADTSAGLVAVGGTTDVDDGSWHHVTATFDGTNIAIYADGGAAENTSAAMSGTVTTTNTFRIGTDGNGSSEPLAGIIAHARIYDIELTQAENDALFFGKGVDGAMPSKLSLQRWYKLDEGGGVDITDYSPNAVIGTLNNATQSTFWASQGRSPSNFLPSVIINPTGTGLSVFGTTPTIDAANNTGVTKFISYQNQASEDTMIPAGTTQTMTCDLSNHQTLDLTSATGTVTFTMNVPTNVCGGELIIKQHAGAAKDLTWVLSSGSFVWFGGEPNWGVDATSAIRSVRWHWDGTDMNLEASPVAS